MPNNKTISMFNDSNTARFARGRKMFVFGINLDCFLKYLHEFLNRARGGGGGAAQPTRPRRPRLAPPRPPAGGISKRMRVSIGNLSILAPHL